MYIHIYTLFTLSYSRTHTHMYAHTHTHTHTHTPAGERSKKHNISQCKQKMVPTTYSFEPQSEHYQAEHAHSVSLIQ